MGLKRTTRVSETVRNVLGEAVHFNEILSVMYRDGQKMSWHDDGEEGERETDLTTPAHPHAAHRIFGTGLGAVVASLSLGSPATMSWRPKAERQQPNAPYYQGHGKRDKRLNPIPVLEVTLSHGVSLN